MLIGDFERIPETFRRDQGDFRPLTFDQRIRGERRPVYDEPDVFRLYAAFADEIAYTSQHRLFGRSMGGKIFAGNECTCASIEDDVRKRTADIDGQTCVTFVHIYTLWK